MAKDVVFHLDADTAKAVMKIMNVASATARAEKGFVKATRQGTKNIQQMESSSDKAVTAVGNMAAQYLSAAAAIGLVTKALAGANEERRKGAELTKEAFPPMARLAQMAGGDPTTYRQLESEAFKSMRQGLTAEQAADLQFVLRSAGMGGARGMFAGMAGTVTDIPELARSVAGLRAGMPAAGGGREVFNQAMIAQRLSTRAGAPQVLMGATRAADMASKLGISPEELLTLTAITSRTMAPEMAGTALNRLFTVGIEKGFEGQGMGFLTGLREKGLSAQELRGYLGNVRAARAFGMYQANLADFTGALPAVIAGGMAAPGTGEAARMEAMAEAHPRLGAMRRLLRATGREAVSAMTSDEALRAMEWETFRERAGTRGRERGRTPWDRWMEQKVLEAAEYMGAGPEWGPPILRSRTWPTTMEQSIDLAPEYIEAVKENTEALQSEAHTGRMNQSE